MKCLFMKQERELLSSAEGSRFLGSQFYSFNLLDKLRSNITE